MSKKDNSPRVTQRDKINQEFRVKEFLWTKRQLEIIDVLKDKNVQIAIVNGPAGSAKTLLSAFVALEYFKQKKVSDILYVRTVIESASKSLGYMPGELSDKFKPYLAPLEEKLDELLDKDITDKLIKEERISAIPVNFLRGHSFNCKFIIADEVQNYTWKEITTLITRIGKFSKMILCGDTMQSDIGDKSGFQQAINIFSDEESIRNGIVSIQLTEEDIMRSQIVKFIVQKINKNPHLNFA